MHPTHGGRVILQLTSEDPEAVRYEVSLLDPTTLWKGAAAVRLADGEVQLDGFADGSPAWMLTMTRAFLRGEWKARQASPSAWPRRITRWREERG
jgi:hypothetical protein